MAFPCACTNVTTTGFPGGPLTSPCPAADAAKDIPAQTISAAGTSPVLLGGGGDFILTGPATGTATFSLVRSNGEGCTAVYQIVVDGNPVGVPFFATGTSINGSADFSVGTGNHTIGLVVAQPGGACAEVITVGSMTVHAECVGNFTPVFIGA